MGVFDPSVFLAQLAAYMAANAVGGALPYSGTPRALWLGHADEAFAAEPYHVLTPFGGQVNWVPLVANSLQLMTTGKTFAAGHAGAAAVFGSLLDAQGRPRRMIDLGANYTLLGATVKPPQPLGLTDNKRYQFVFNFDVLAAHVA